MFSLISVSIIPFIVLVVLVHGYVKGVDLYDCFVEGAKEGLKTTIKIMPYLIAIFVAIGIFKRSSAMDLVVELFSPITSRLGIDEGLLPLILMKPISGSGSLALVKNITHTYGANSLISKIAGTMMGSAETIFYTMAIYFSAVGIKNTRHTLKAALISHISAVIASIMVCNYLFG